MADKKCAGSVQAPPCCELTWLRRRRELEDMPMTRIDLRADACSADEAGCCCGCCGCCGDGGEVAQLLAQQNKILCDILGAVSSLTAAQLARMKKEP